MTHFTDETLLNYLGDRLSVEGRSQVEAHAASCQECGRRLARLRTVLQTISNDWTVAPPEAILKQAVAIRHSRRAPSQPTPWMRVFAALRFDSRLQLSGAATRGTARARQMLFTTEQMDIDLQIKPGRTDHDVLGQMLSTQRSGGTVPAFVSLQDSAGLLLQTTETDSLGQFAFRQVPPGSYELVFDLENQEVAITGLEFTDD